MDQEAQPGTGTAHPRTIDMAEMALRCYPDTLAFYHYWLAKCRPAKFHDEDGTPRPMPARADLDPPEMKSWLPGIQLVDVLRDQSTPDTRSPATESPGDYRLIYRLVGESEVAFHGCNPTGRPVIEAAIGHGPAAALYNYHTVITQRRPLYDWSRVPHPNGFLISQECILLPLSEDGTTVNMVVTYGKVVRSSPARGRIR